MVRSGAGPPQENAHKKGPRSTAALLTSRICVLNCLVLLVGTRLRIVEVVLQVLLPVGSLLVDGRLAPLQFTLIGVPEFSLGGIVAEPFLLFLRLPVDFLALLLVALLAVLLGPLLFPIVFLRLLALGKDGFRNKARERRERKDRLQKHHPLLHNSSMRCDRRRNRRRTKRKQKPRLRN